MEDEKYRKIEQFKNLRDLPLHYQLMTTKHVQLSEVPRLKIAKVDFYQTEKVYLRCIEKPISRLFFLSNAE